MILCVVTLFSILRGNQVILARGGTSGSDLHQFLYQIDRKDIMEAVPKEVQEARERLRSRMAGVGVFCCTLVVGSRFC